MLVLNEAKLKYEFLDGMLLDLLNDIRFSQNVSIIVDLKEIFKKIFRPGVIPEEIKNPGKLSREITSDIISIVSHYRNYFFKNSKYTTFYFLYGKEECKTLKEVYPDYKKKHYEKYYGDSDLVKVKEKSLKSLEIFLNAIPNVSFIDTSEFEDISIVKFIKNKTSNNQLIFLLTNDFHYFQALDDRHIFAINCKGIKSELIRENNAIKYIANMDEKQPFSSKLLPLMLAISGNSKYSLANIKGIGLQRSIAIVNNLLQKSLISDTDYINMPLRKENLNCKDKVENIILENFEELERNYNVITCNNILYSNEIKITQLLNITRPVVNIEKLKEINNKIFYENPINLDMLLKGEKL